MSYLDLHKQSFLRNHAKYINRHMEDASSLGFNIRFLFEEAYEAEFPDLVPGSLLYLDNQFIDEYPLVDDAKTLKASSSASALNYLSKLDKGPYRNAPRAQILRGMISELLYLQNKTPWFFQSLSGLDSAYKVEHEGNRYGKEGGSITIETLESIDHRVSFLIDSYRNVAWDMNSMSWILPENLRKFGMEIIITEFAGFHTKDNLYELATETTGLGSFIENNFPGAYNTVKNLQGKSKIIQQSLKDLTTGDIGALFVLDAFTDVTVRVIKLQNCEFKLLGDYVLPYLNKFEQDKPTDATNQLVIDFNRSKTVTNYSLLEYIINDGKEPLTRYHNKNGKTGAEENLKNKVELYKEIYFKDRDRLATNYAVTKIKDRAQAIALGNYNPFDDVKNKVTGGFNNINPFS